MSKFKNITKNDLMIPDFGIVKAGETVEMPDGFHNVNFELVGKKKETADDSNDNK